MILHITNDFSGSTVYQNLIRELDHLNIPQIVYNPIRDISRVGKNSIDLLNTNSEIIFSSILNSHTDRLFYHQKIKKIQYDIETRINFSKIKIIHAHTWFSDGGVAYEIFKKHDIPYIIAMRNTDLNLFWKLPHLKSYGLNILKNASKVIIISEAYKTRVLANSKIGKCIESKYEVISNGVDPFWLRNSLTHQNENKSDNVQILYIGKFNSGKNVRNLIKAVLQLQQQFNTVKLSLVGGGGDHHKEILRLVSDNSSVINYFGEVNDKYELLQIFRSHKIFAMPSKRETFGLVYIEALLQGLPVLYTKKEGIDGFYGDEIGEGVENTSIKEIKDKLKKLIVNLENYRYDINKIKLNHNWILIAKKYNDIYNLTLKKAKKTIG